MYLIIPGESLYTLLVATSRTGLEKHSINGQEINLFTLILNLTRFLLFSAILIFFRKVVMKFVVGNIFGESTRKNLKYMGLSTIMLGILKMFMNVYLPYVFGKGLTLFSLNFKGFESTYFIIALGLLFIYMSKVLKESSILKEENALTI